MVLPFVFVFDLYDCFCYWICSRILIGFEFFFFVIGLVVGLVFGFVTGFIFGFVIGFASWFVVGFRNCFCNWVCS